jgi:hypothetical protein
MRTDEDASDYNNTKMTTTTMMMKILGKQQ